MPRFGSFIIYFLVPVILTQISLFISNWLDKDSIEATNGESAIKDIEEANNAFLPSYLVYFFVALSVPNCETLVFVFLILFLFTFLSQTLYFNPLFLIFGYRFFYLTTLNNVKVFLITKKRLKNPNKLNFPSLRRITDFTFIDTKKQKT